MAIIAHSILDCADRKGDLPLATYQLEGLAALGDSTDLIRASDDFELLSGPNLSITCFRHLPPGATDAELDDHNERLLTALQRDGRVHLSNLTVDGHFAFRACITNFRTTRADLPRTLAVIRELAEA